MQNTIHIWPQNSIETNDQITLSVVIEREGASPFNLWFRIPAEYKDKLSETCDPFVVATIFLAMRTSVKMIVHGIVSPSLLRNLEEFQAVWINWQPDRYAKIDITGTIESEPNNHNHRKGAVMAFSGGLDSCFTAYRHRMDICGRQQRNIHAGVMVHGFDIPLDDKGTFDIAAEKSKNILQSLGIELIPVATNFRDLGDNWDDAHAAGIAACLMLFQNGYKCGLISGSFSYNSFGLNIGWGSNPLTDRFLSSGSFEIINDGSRFDRVDKLEYIASWPHALENMRVCWEGKHLDRNCCECEKCIRNILSFYALGLKLPKSFEKDITEQQIKNVRVPDSAILFEYKCALSTAKSRGITAPWVKALEKGIQLNERRLANHNGSLWRKVRSKVALRTRLRRLNARYLQGSQKEK